MCVFDVLVVLHFVDENKSLTTSLVTGKCAYNLTFTVHTAVGVFPGYILRGALCNTGVYLT